MMYLGVGLLNDPDFPFKEDEILKMKIVDETVVISKPKWYELLDWSMFEKSYINELPEEARKYAYNSLNENVKVKDDE